MEKPLLSPARLLFGVYLLVLIVLLELALHWLELPTWPVFLIMIFFFEAHMNRQRAPHLLIGALVGISCYIATVFFVSLAAPTLGAWPAKLVFICAVVYAIVAFGEAFPVVFNNYAFMFYLVSGLAARDTSMDPAPLTWMGLVVAGGAVVIAGILLIGRLVAKTSAAVAPQGGG